MLETMRTVLFSPAGNMFIGVLIGAIVTFIVAHCYYLRSSRELRWEARAGAIPQSTLELLVAYADWGEDLQSDQGISISSDSNQPDLGLMRFKHVVKLLRDVGLANIVARGFGRPIGSEDTGPIPEGYSILFITEEGKELASYIKKARGIDQRVVELFRFAPDGQSQAPLECLWTIVPGKKPGPIDECWKHNE